MPTPRAPAKFKGAGGEGVGGRVFCARRVGKTQRVASTSPPPPNHLTITRSAAANTSVHTGWPAPPRLRCAIRPSTGPLFRRLPGTVGYEEMLTISTSLI